MHVRAIAELASPWDLGGFYFFAHEHSYGGYKQKKKIQKRGSYVRRKPFNASPACWSPIRPSFVGDP